jgi:hypothetical protein
MSKNRKRNPAHREAVRYKIFLPHSGTDMHIGAAQWQHHLKIGNLVRVSTDPELKQRLRSNQRLAVVKPGLYAYESEITSSLEFAPLQGFRVNLASPSNSHRAGWQNWLYKPPFTSGNEAIRLQRNAEPRYSEVCEKDPTNRVEIW